MFCTACGTTIPAGQAACPQCGQAAAFENPPIASAESPTPAPPAVSSPISHLGFELERYRIHIRTLSIAWFIYAGLSLLLGFAGLSFARFFLMGSLHLPMRGPYGRMDPNILPLAIHLAWIFLAIRALLAVIAGWALLQQTRWSRTLAIVIAILTLFRFPLGTALGIWTLVMLLGDRHAILYERR
jgi:hypothetical protein